MRRHAFGDAFEALIGAKRIALAGEHAGRVFALALEGEHAGRVGEGARNIFPQKKAQDLAIILEARQRHLADLGARQRFGGELGANLLVANLHDVLRLCVQLLGLRPLLQQLALSGLSSASLAAINSSNPVAARPDDANKAFETLSDWRSRAMRAWRATDW